MLFYNVGNCPFIFGILGTRLILSHSTITMLSQLKCAGLPNFTDESPKCRLTELEAEAINNLSSGCELKIVVVRNIPFAPFLSIGALLFLLLLFYLRY